jgi:uncharacterized membrane protein HdeD (DUF308 family)
MAKKISSSATETLYKHKQSITIPGFDWGVTAGVAIIITTTVLAFMMFFYTPLAPFLQDVAPELYVFMVFFLIANYVCATITIIASFLIKHEDHSLAGSILILAVSTFGLIFSIGLWVGPALGIISGVLGLKEHHALIKAHHEILSK